MTTHTPRPINQFPRSEAFDPGIEAHCTRAKTKSGGVLGNVNSTAIHASEDATRRRFAAACGGLNIRIGCIRPLRKD